MPVITLMSPVGHTHLAKAFYGIANASHSSAIAKMNRAFLNRLAPLLRLQIETVCGIHLLGPSPSSVCRCISSYASVASNRASDYDGQGWKYVSGSLISPVTGCSCCKTYLQGAFVTQACFSIRVKYDDISTIRTLFPAQLLLWLPSLSPRLHALQTHR